MNGQNNPLDENQTNNQNPVGWDPNAIPSFNTPTPADAPMPVNAAEIKTETPFIPAPAPTPLMSSPVQPEELPAAPAPIVQGSVPVVAVDYSEAAAAAPVVTAPVSNAFTPSFGEAKTAASEFSTPSLVTPTGASNLSTAEPQFAPTPVNQSPEDNTVIAPRTFEMPTSQKPTIPSFFASSESVPEVSTPPTPVSVVDVRTLMSDAESLRNSGGAEAAGSTFTVNDFVSGATATAAATTAVSGANPVTNKPGAPRKTLIIVAIVVAVGLIVIAAVGFYLYKSSQSPVVIEQPAEQAVPQAPAVVPAEQETAAVAPIRTHTSALVTPADKVEQKTLELSLIAIKDALFTNEAGQVYPASSLKEIVLAKIGGGYISFSEFANVLLPDVDNTLIKADLEDDFTAVVFQDKKTPMLGFIVGTKNEKADADLAGLIEKSSSLANLFASAPGAQAKEWKDGQVLEKDVRFVAFPNAGAAFEYAWIKDKAGKKYLVVATSYNAMQEIIKRAGF